MTRKKIHKVDEPENVSGFWGVRFRSPSMFEKMRRPAWATKVARSESAGSHVIMGKTPSGNWLAQSVRIKKAAGDKSYARRTAREIRKKIEGD